MTTKNRKSSKIAARSTKKTKQSKTSTKSKKLKKAFKDDLNNAIDETKEIIKQTLKISTSEQQKSSKKCPGDYRLTKADIMREAKLEAKRLQQLKKSEDVDFELSNDDNIYNDSDSTQQSESSKKKSKPAEAKITFFYTNDKYFNQMDDKLIVASIQQKYPLFMKNGVSENDLKQVIVEIIQDRKFVDGLMDFYNLSMHEFFKFMFRRETSVFRGPFLNKLHKVLRECGYTN